jgi:hypothetical protein
MSSEAFNAWARTWPDEGVPGLEGMTPRLAATCLWPYPAGGQLRDLEHRAAASGARGLRDVDVAGLRSVLGMGTDARPELGAHRPI